MKKVLTLILFIVLTTLSLGKNIYVVYDDSLSMKKDNRSVYANYAIQTLIALQEPEDTLVITRMSDHKNQFRNKLFIDLKDISKELEYFRQNINPKSMVTPYKAVESMLDYIDKVDEKGENSWLIIISDGFFEDGKPIPDLENVKKKIQNVAHGKKIRPIFLLIGSDEQQLADYEQQTGIQIWKDTYGEGEYPKVYKSIGKDDIVDKMSKIAQLLTNKSESKEKNYRIEENRIIFSPLFPLKKVILLQQGDVEKNGVKSVVINGEKVEKIDTFFPKKEIKSLKLSGNVVHIDTKGKKIKDNGDFVIEFNGKVPESIKLYPEVAGKFEVKIFDETGKEIKERFNVIEEGKKIKIVCKLLNSSTNKPLDYKDGILVRINYGGKTIPLKYDKDKKEFVSELDTLKDKKSIDAIAEYDGYFYYQSDIYIIEGIERKEPVVPVEPPKPVEKPKPVAPPKPVEKPKPVAPPKPQIYTLNLEKNLNDEVISQEQLEKFVIKIVPKLNGLGLDENQFKALKLDIDSKLKGKVITKWNYWEFVPKIYKGSYNYKKPQGQYVIDVNVSGEKIDLHKSEKVNIEELSFLTKYGLLICHFIAFIIAVILIYGYITKKRFSKKAKVVFKEYKDDFNKPERNKKLKASFINRILPFIPHTMSIDGIVFCAAGRFVTVSGQDLSKRFNSLRVKKIYVNGDLIEKEELIKKNKYSIYDENSIKVEYEDKLTKEYIYRKN